MNRYTDTDVIHMIKWIRPYPHTASVQKLDGGKVWEQVY